MEGIAAHKINVSSEDAEDRDPESTRDWILQNVHQELETGIRFLEKIFDEHFSMKCWFPTNGF